MPTEKEKVIEKFQEVVGRVPIDIRDTLSILAHPEVIEFTKRYLDYMDVENRCLIHEYPWSCAKEAGSRYEFMTFGGLGAAVNDGGYSDGWCKPCWTKLMDS